MSRQRNLELDAEANVIRGDTTLLDAFLSETPKKYITHFVAARGRKTACGREGIEPNTNAGSDCTGGVTCDDCRVELAKQAACADRAGLKRLAKGPVSVRDFGRDTRHRLIEAGRAKQVGGSLMITLDGIAFLGPVKARAKASAADPQHSRTNGLDDKEVG